jgi:hypothetical protein
MARRNILSIVFCLLTAGAVFAQNKVEHKYFTTSDGVKIHFMVKGKGAPDGHYGGLHAEGVPRKRR